MPLISAIIVAYNEEMLIQSIISELQKQRLDANFEIILADGGSTDRTVSLAQQKGVSVIQCRKGKACQMNGAAKIAQGEILFFVHADMQFSENIFSLIQQKVNRGYDGGGFANFFDKKNNKIKSLGHWMNFRFFNKNEQSDKGIFYGDNGIFVRKKVFDELDGFKEISIMEDYDFSNRMRQKYKVVKIKDTPIIVSARRHIKAGFWKTRFQWVMIRKLYKWGISPDILARWYGDVR